MYVLRYSSRSVERNKEKDLDQDTKYTQLHDNKVTYNRRIFDINSIQ
jgi:hypothetical protein